MTTTTPYLVIGTSPFNGMDTVDECDSLEEAREFANEHGGKCFSLWKQQRYCITVL